MTTNIDTADDESTPTAADIRTAVLAVRDLTIEALTAGPATPRSADLSGMPRGSGGIDRPLPGGSSTSLLGPYSEPSDDTSYEPDDSPVVAQTIVGWARTVARLRYAAEPHALGPAFTFLVTQADFVAAQPALAARLAREVEAVAAALRSVVLPEVDERHDSRPTTLHLPALAGAVPDDAMLLPRDAEKFGIDGVAAWASVRRSRRSGYGPLGEPDSQGRFEMSGYRAWVEYIEAERARRAARTEVAA